MAGAALLGRLEWTLGEVVDLVAETPRVKSIVLDVPGWPGHRAGQHVDVRLTDEDGYQAQRSYSIASAPEDGRLTITVERLEDGEVSPFFVDELRAGDRFELRGPIGGYFVWEAGTPGPLLLVGGGSGVVPLMAIARHRVAAGDRTPARLLYSARTFEDVIYREELERLAARGNGFEVVYTLTRDRPPGWTGYDRRVDADLLAEAGFAEHGAHVYVCGPTGFVETVASALVGLGHEPGRIRTERFGPTGG